MIEENMTDEKIVERVQQGDCERKSKVITVTKINDDHVSGEL
jgi:hypothetical protein